MPATSSVDTPERAGEFLVIPVAAATTIYLGTLVAINAAGRAVPASNTAGLRVAGRAEQDVDNSAGAAGAREIIVKRGTFRYANSGSAPVPALGVGKVVLVEDDQTVTATATNNVKAGVAVEVDATFVWMNTHSVITG